MNNTVKDGVSKYAERLLRLNKITQEEFDEIKAIHDKFNKLEGKDDFEKYQILRDSIDDIKRYYKDLASNDLEKLITSYM